LCITRFIFLEQPQLYLWFRIVKIVLQLKGGVLVMRKGVFLTLVLIGSLFSLLWLASSQASSSPTPSMPSKEAVSAKLATLERGWVKNEGQWDKQALFSAPGYFGTTWITKDGELSHVAVKKEECKEKACPSKSWVISERWVGGKVQAIKGEEELQTKVSYFIGNDPSKHRSGLSTYRYVSLGEVWSGVEVKLKATQKTVEKLFYIKPGADPSKIVVEVDGAKGLKLSKDGEIIIQTGLGELKLSKPIAWQEKDGKKLAVEVSYKLIGKNRYSFVVAKVDLNLPLVIDPILQATYLGGGDDDIAHALAIHPTTGEVYVAGYTSSANFPNTSGGAQARYGENGDAFVARLNSNLTQIFQSTYLGGSYGDSAQAIAIHPTTGEIYVAGFTYSTNFPKTTGGAQRSYGGGRGDAFVAKLNKELTQVLQSTYLGGGIKDEVSAIAIHPTTGEVYVAGYTSSANFPNTSGGAQARYGENGDAFVARLNSNLTQIFQSTYLGGSYGDSAQAIAIHPTTGEIYVAGFTYSTNFPKTTGGAQRSYGGGRGDAFVAKLNKELTQVLQSTYLGGGIKDEVSAIAIHPTTGEVYVAGYTSSANFPNTSGGAQARCRSCPDYPDAFVAKLNKELTQVLQSTYLGGGGSDETSALVIHPTTGEVYVAGRTTSKDFPKTTNGAQATCNKCVSGLFPSYDAFVARLNKELTQILQSTYIGGSDTDWVDALAIHPKTGEVYVAGYTLSTNFPKTTGGVQVSLSGGQDAFVSRLNSNLTQILQSTYLGGSSWDTAHALAIHPTTGEIYVAGWTVSYDFPKTAGGAQTECKGCNIGRIYIIHDAFVARLTADLAGGRKSSDGGGYYTTGSVSSMAGFWNILVWLSVPAFALARRIRRK
jgi:muconolactone delta-isomerase